MVTANGTGESGTKVSLGWQGLGWRMPSLISLGGSRGGAAGESGAPVPTCVLTCVHEYILHLWYSRVTAWMCCFQYLPSTVPHLQRTDTRHLECPVGTAAHPQDCRGGGGLSACGPQAQTTSPTRHCPVPCRVPRHDMLQHPTGGAVLWGALGGLWGLTSQTTVFLPVPGLQQRHKVAGRIPPLLHICGEKGRGMILLVSPTPGLCRPGGH